MGTVVLITNLKFEDSDFNSSRLLIYSMEEEQSVVGASNSSTTPICRTIETEIGSNIRENSDNNIDILGEEAKSNDYKLPKPSILESDNELDLEDIECLQSMKSYGSMVLCNFVSTYGLKIDLMPQFEGHKYFALRNNESTTCIKIGDVFHDKVLLFFYLSGHNSSTNKLVIIYIMLSVFERCIEYEREQPGDYSFRNGLFSYRENWFMETYDDIELLMKTGRLLSSHRFTAIKLMKLFLQSPFCEDLENMSTVKHTGDDSHVEEMPTTNDDRQVNFEDDDQQVNYEDHRDDYEMNRVDQPQSVAKFSKVLTQARELLGGGFIRSGTRKRSTVQELRTAQEAKEGESYYTCSRVLV
jgi:hypothetical protein